MKLSKHFSNHNEGYPIVLTTDRTLASDYNGSEFIGFGSTFPKILPSIIYNTIFSPPLPHSQGIMEFGHCGSRKIEASLLNDGFSEKDVIVAHPNHLEKVIGPKTKAIGITTHDPLGLGPASTTFSSLVGGEPYSSLYFKKLVSNKLIRKYQLNVVVGGPGTWQLDDKRIMEKMGIDTIVIGEGEKVAPNLFHKAVNGESLPKKVEGKVVPVDEIPSIKAPTVNGIIEISRGCGRGCDFCNPTLLNLRHRPMDKIIEEVKINCEGGNELALLHAEDVLRYGSKKLVPNPEKLMKLLKSVKQYTDKIGFSHCSLASAAAKPDLIEDITELLDIGSSKYPFTSPQVGIETGSPELASKHIRGKAKPFDIEEWPSVVKNSIQIFNDNDWIPCTTLIMGLPEETSDDVLKTIELLDDMDENDFFVVPLMFVPLGTSQNNDFFSAEDMLPEHWQLLAKCIEKDLKITGEMIPKLAKMDDISTFKRYIFTILKKYAEHKIKPFMDDMKEGRNPINDLP